MMLLEHSLTQTSKCGVSASIARFHVTGVISACSSLIRAEPGYVWPVFPKPASELTLKSSVRLPASEFLLSFSYQYLLLTCGYDGLILDEHLLLRGVILFYARVFWSLRQLLFGEAT